MNQDIFTVSELLDIFSPSTLASLIQDIDQLCKGADTKQFHLRSECYMALVANVGIKDAIEMIGEHSIGESAPDYSFACSICGKKAASTEAAIDADWTPSFCEEGEETCEPVCPECCVRYLTPNEDGDLEPKPGVSIAAARRFHAASHLTT